MSKDLVITRTFAASRDAVWKAWTDANSLKRWWGPKGFEMVRLTVDLKPGGKMHYGMKAPNGAVMWGRFVYEEIEPEDRLSFIVSFSDEAGGITANPFNPVWPAEVMNTLELADAVEGTVLILRGSPVRATADQIKSFEDNFANLNQGFKGTLDQLAEELA
jgi:uncharacterized protein YndB with AHSA1/START domain